MKIARTTNRDNQSLPHIVPKQSTSSYNQRKTSIEFQKPKVYFRHLFFLPKWFPLNKKNTRKNTTSIKRLHIFFQLPISQQLKRLTSLSNEKNSTSHPHSQITRMNQTKNQPANLNVNRIWSESRTKMRRNIIGVLSRIYYPQRTHYLSLVVPPKIIMPRVCLGIHLCARNTINRLRLRNEFVCSLLVRCTIEIVEMLSMFCDKLFILYLFNSKILDYI